MTNHTGTVYTKNETELSWLIESGIVCDENQKGQWRDQSYKSAYAENEIELSRPIRLVSDCDENQIRQRRD